MVEIRQTDVYADWFDRLRDQRAKARIDIRIRRLSLSNPGDVAPVGGGISELRIPYGPGYRIISFSGELHSLFFCAAVISQRKPPTSSAHTH